MVFHCGVNLQFLLAKIVEYLFICFLAACISSFVKCFEPIICYSVTNIKNHLLHTNWQFGQNLV